MDLRWGEGKESNLWALLLPPVLGGAICSKRSLQWEPLPSQHGGQWGTAEDLASLTHNMYQSS